MVSRYDVIPIIKPDILFSISD